MHVKRCCYKCLLEQRSDFYCEAMLLWRMQHMVWHCLELRSGTCVSVLVRPLGAHCLLAPAWRSPATSSTVCSAPCLNPLIILHTVVCGILKSLYNICIQLFSYNFQMQFVSNEWNVKQIWAVHTQSRNWSVVRGGKMLL